MLSKFFPCRECLKTVGISGVVEHDKDIFVRVLDDLMPGLADNFNDRGVRVSLGDRGTFMVGG